MVVSGKTFTDINVQNQPSSLLVKEDWRMAILGSGIGKSGIITADIDQDGVPEIIADGSTSTFGSGNFWSVFKYSSASSGYSSHWTSNLYSEGISKLAAFDLNNDGNHSIFVGLNNGEVDIYDGVTLEKVGYIDSPASSVNQILWADADNDLINDLIIGDDETTFIYDINSLSIKHKIPYGGSEFKIGNVDSDSANEIVFSSGTVIELNGVNATEEWNYAGGDFGYLIELSDIDSDNKQEIIGASPWYKVTAFDADIQSPKWEISTDLDVDALLVTDVDNDGIEEVIYGDGQWGEIHAYDAVTVTQKWQIDNPDHGVTDLAVFDTDSDGELEILWGAGASSTGADHLFVYGIPALSPEWQSQHIDGPFPAIDVDDIDNDGQQEIVFASFESDSGYSDGTLFIYDATTKALEWQSPTDMFGGHAWTGIHDLKIGDVDDDGTKEIVVGTDRLYDGAVYVIDGQSKEIEQSYFYDDGAPIYSIDIADVDNDGQTEIIAGGGREHTGAPGVYVYAINGSSGVVEWKSISLGDYWSDIHVVQVGNIDNDDAPEIVALKDNIFVFDGISHQQWQSSIGGYSSLDLHDIDNDGKEEIIVGTDQGNIAFINGETFEEEFNLNVSSSPIVSLQAQDINQDGTVELTYTSSAALGVYSLEESSLLWQSEPLGASAGNDNSLMVSDIDSDGSTEILVGTDYAVIEFEVVGNAPPVLDLNGSASGIDYTATFTATPIPIVDTGFTLTDADSTTLANTTVQITNLTDDAEEVLTADTSGTAITAQYDDNTGTLTLSGVDTVANYQQVLGTITYNNTAATPNTTDRIIEFVVNDGASESNLSSVATTTVSFSSAPIANNDTVTTDEDTPVTIDVLDNDSDPDNNPLNVSSIDTTNTQGQVTINTDNTLTYDPNTAFESLGPGESSTDSFTYTISDGNGGTSTATVTVTATGVNDAPILTPVSKIGDEDTDIQFTANDFTQAFNDPEGSTLSQITIISLPNNGLLNVNGNAVQPGDEITVAQLDNLSFTPDANFHGSADFAWNASDGTLFAPGTTVNLTVNPINDSPVAFDDSATTPQDTPITIDVLANDSDPIEADLLHIDTFDTTSVSGGTITLDDNGTANDLTDDQLIYTPTTGYIGNDSFTYTISDSDGGIATATVNLTVNPANDMTLVGTPQDDTLVADSGDDMLFGLAGNDTLQGEAGDDLADGGVGDDTLFGGDGQDNLFGNVGNDLLDGGLSADVLDGGDGADMLLGNQGDDLLFGDLGDDLLMGDEGDDFLDAGEGKDILFADMGNDTLTGGEGDDFLRGGTGDDLLDGGEGNDRLFGDSGADQFLLRLGEGMDMVFNFSDGEDSFLLANGLTFDQLTITSSGYSSAITVAGEQLATVFGVPANLITEADFTVA